MSDRINPISSMQYESYNDSWKPVLIDGLVIHNPKPVSHNVNVQTPSAKQEPPKNVDVSKKTGDGAPSNVIENENREDAETIKEGYTVAELDNLYRSIAPNKGEFSTIHEDHNVIQRKYDMDTQITYPPNHPNYKPSDKEIIMRDTRQIMEQQYNTLIMTVAATASLGIIVFMLTSK
jgi:hypothetical protein